MQHSPGFLKMVNQARPRVSEIDIAQARDLLQNKEKVVLVDVREDAEWAAGHARQAIHLGKGVLERDIETKIPDRSTELIFYCGGGYRSVLAADAAQQMGYHKTYSLMGGYKAMVQENWPMDTDEQR